MPTSRNALNRLFRVYEDGAHVSDFNSGWWRTDERVARLARLFYPGKRVELREVTNFDGEEGHIIVVEPT